jgi:tRNA dimethylallyltransferase
MSQQTVLCLMGPTASGKTALALQLADEFPVDIISVDSALVFRDMNIGTAKPKPDILRKVPHRLVDILEPEETYSAGDFVRDARREIDLIQSAGRIPLLVGGTMMYFRALTEGLAQLPRADEAVRAAIDRQAADIGWPALHEQLQEFDPVAAARINRNDSQRLQRAHEVFRISGRTLTDWQKDTQAQTDSNSYLKIALIAESRAELHKRIELRLRQMLEEGFVEEVIGLMDRAGLTREHASMRAVGYRQLWSHLAGDDSLKDATQKALAATRQLCKRQLTWLRNDPDLHKFDPLEKGWAALISTFLERQLEAANQDTRE